MFELICENCGERMTWRTLTTNTGNPIRYSVEPCRKCKLDTYWTGARDGAQHEANGDPIVEVVAQ